MCERWKEAGSRFPKYPRLPVHECAGYVKRTDDPGEKKNDVEGNK